MGLLDRAIDGINRVARPFQQLSTPTDPRLKSGARLVERGTPASATIVGIRRDYRQDATHTTFALRLAGSPASGPSRFGTEVSTSPHLHRLRLGLSVPVRIDGDRGVIDWPALATAWGLTDGAPGQRPQRDAPPDGIDERSLTTAQRKLLEHGRAASATVTHLDRCFVMGMATLNWDVHLCVDDATTCTVEGDEIPPYAWWIARRGAVVPVAVDPGDPSRVVVDWATAIETSGGPIGLHDLPPEGSIAASMSPSAPPSTTPTTSATPDTSAVVAAHRDEAAVTGTLAEWAGEVRAGRMKPKKFLSHVAEWEAAGLCTPREAEAARRAAATED